MPLLSKLFAAILWIIPVPAGLRLLFYRPYRRRRRTRLDVRLGQVASFLVAVSTRFVLDLEK